MVSGGSGVALRYPRFEFSYAKRVADGVGLEAGVGGNVDIYSASFATVGEQQDYDLQSILITAAGTGKDASGGTIAWPATAVSSSDGTSTKVDIRKVYYKTPHAMWRFYGYYGGLNTVGNLSNYGQYTDDSTFEVLPAWQNKAQAMAFEDAIWTRNSHYSYELRNNNLRIFPPPSVSGSMWIEYSKVTERDNVLRTRYSGSVDTISDASNAPYDNMKYSHINDVGKTWIRKYGLALSKELLGMVRSKYGTIPIPNSDVSLDGDTLRAEATAEKDQLMEQLREMLDQTSNKALLEADREASDNLQEKLKKVPYPIYIG